MPVVFIRFSKGSITTQKILSRTPKVSVKSSLYVEDLTMERIMAESSRLGPTSTYL